MQQDVADGIDDLDESREQLVIATPELNIPGANAVSVTNQQVQACHNRHVNRVQVSECSANVDNGLTI